MDDEFDVYGFCVEVWEDEGEWCYSVIQEFDDDTEVLLYGVAETSTEALRIVGHFVAYEMNF